MKPWYNTWLLKSFPDRDAITREDLKMHPSSIYPRPLAAFRLRHKEIIIPDQRLHEGDKSQPINAAKGSMRVDLNEALLDIARPRLFCPKQCSKYKACLWEYMDEVILTKLWPFSVQHREAIQSVLDSTGMTKWTYRPVAGACMSCVDRLGGAHVKRARYDVANCWTGMCLDCVNLSMDQAGTKYAAYFSKDKPCGYDGGCRLRYARNEWYHAFMGPQEAMAKYREDRRDM
ncbi:hypothetical protein BKA65DRAFT_557835 [Rhexocercosporidium sp. MPI-PUGE-AT-0058]|nr:hypothetical protein BKA65DRAFT_557835 [Rhexocercosporidium sp. MPI-PUGE-AT-0058]